MLLGVLLIAILLNEVYYSDGDTKPCTFPIPLELPNRNDRSDQCWLRIEDVELTETVTLWCYIAHAFLRNYIHDYNSKKMTEDKVDVSLWSEDPRPQNDIVPKTVDEMGIKDWKLTTVMDPAMHMRIYVSKQADCRLIMYTREGMTNYKIDCERILYYVNERMYGAATVSRAQGILVSVCIFLIIISFPIIL
ncbi:unnamed protein product [Diatraea saccharalis]|uniref:Uncharacterized protein n=1 Tax=Diatraea saccharalis TaxID=40085 RepID=A0A9N9QV69_9NEOP|nr:unnamed protein product [Diatraea saccharalis]